MIITRTKGPREVFLATGDQFVDYVWLNATDSNVSDLSIVTDIYVGFTTHPDLPPVGNADWNLIDESYDVVQFPKLGNIRIGYFLGEDGIENCHHLELSGDLQAWMRFGDETSTIIFRCGKLRVHR